MVPYVGLNARAIQRTPKRGSDNLDGDGDLDLLNKPYNWDTPRVDVWLNNGTRVAGKGVGASRSFAGPVGLQLYSLRDILGQNALMHVKDIRKGTKTGLLTGSEDVRNDVALGFGQIDLPATLRTAQQVGVKHYFIEDESPSSTQQIPQSLRYLEST